MSRQKGFAFAGSGLDRAAQLRGDAAALKVLWQGPGARVLPVWRGKLLFDAEGGLAWVPPGHATLTDAKEPPIFLGRDGGTLWFAQDISAWQPEGPLPEAGVFLDASAQLHPALPEGQAFSELRARIADLDPRAAELAAMARALPEWHACHRFCARCGAATVPEMAGWQRRCPACAGQHFPRTDPVVIMLVTRANTALIGRSPGWPEGMYSCLAGFMEPGETLESAVRREVFEETGVEVGPVRYVASQPWPFPASLMLGTWAVAHSETITRDPVEIEDALWVSREEMALIFAGQHPKIRAPRQGAIAQFLLRQWLADRLD